VQPKALLPALLLPNSQNAQDTRAIAKDGSTYRATDLFRLIGPQKSLRFMVQANDPRTSSSPRITWQDNPDGTCIMSAAFVAGTDSYQRSASAALIFSYDGTNEFLEEIPAGLPAEQLETLRAALREMNSNLFDYVSTQRQLGVKGGEYMAEKKNSSMRRGKIGWRLAIVNWVTKILRRVLGFSGRS